MIGTFFATGFHRMLHDKSFRRAAASLRLFFLKSSTDRISGWCKVLSDHRCL